MSMGRLCSANDSREYRATALDIIERGNSSDAERLVSSSFSSTRMQASIYRRLVRVISGGGLASRDALVGHCVVGDSVSWRSRFKCMASSRSCPAKGSRLRSREMRNAKSKTTWEEPRMALVFHSGPGQILCDDSERSKSISDIWLSGKESDVSPLKMLEITTW